MSNQSSMKFGWQIGDGVGERHSGGGGGERHSGGGGERHSGGGGEWHSSGGERRRGELQGSVEEERKLHHAVSIHNSDITSFWLLRFGMLLNGASLCCLRMVQSPKLAAISNPRPLLFKHESFPHFFWFPDFFGPKKSWNQYKLCSLLSCLINSLGPFEYLWLYKRNK